VAAPERDRRHGQPEDQREDLDLPEPERERLDQPREERDGGDQEHGDLRGRGERDFGRELDLSAPRDDHRATVLGGVSDDRDDHRRDEEVRQPDLLGELLERADEDLRDQRRDDRSRAEDEERCPQRPALDVIVTRDVQLPVPPERVDRHDPVHDEQHDRDRHGDDGDRVSVGIAVPRRDRGHEEERDRNADRGERQEARRPVELVAAAREEREAEDE